jgi:hypothetical protein
MGGRARRSRDRRPRAQIYNGLVASGFTQIGTRAALGELPGDLAAANAEWQRRRDETLRQLAGLPVVRPAGAWSLLLDVATLGLDPREVSHRLLEERWPRRRWSVGHPIADRHVRFVFSTAGRRLATLGGRVRAAVDAARSNDHRQSLRQGGRCPPGHGVAERESRFMRVEVVTLPCAKRREAVKCFRRGFARDRDVRMSLRRLGVAGQCVCPQETSPHSPIFAGHCTG